MINGNKLIAFLVAAVLVLSLVPLEADAFVSEVNTEGSNIKLDSCDNFSITKVYLNDKPMNLNNCKTYICKDELMIPLRLVSEALGAVVGWDSEICRVSLSRGENVTYLNNGNVDILVNGECRTLRVAPHIENGTTYVPCDFIQKVFGFNTVYNHTASEVRIEMDEFPLYYAKGFKIKYLEDGCKLVTDGEDFRLLLVPKGQNAPAGVIADKVISIPLESTMTLSSTFVGSLDKLDVLDSVVAVSTSKDYWFIPEIKEALSEGSVTYVGGDNMEPPDYEIVKSVGPELAFVYTGDVGQRNVMRKFDSIGVPYAVNNEYLEKNPLGRMEWIKFMAAFYDKEMEAEALFNRAVESVMETKAKVADEEKPKVAWGLSWVSKVYVADPDSYVGRWIDDCAGDYVFGGINMGEDIQVSMEDFYAYAKDADVFIYSSTTNYMNNPTIEGIVDENPLFANIKAVKEGNVWAYAPDWWQTIYESDIIEKDIAAAFHPDKFPNHQFTKLVKLPVE